MAKRIWWIAMAGVWVLGGACARVPATKAPPPVAPSRPPDPSRVWNQRLVAFGLRVAPLARELNLAFWRAASSGDPDAWAQAAARELEIRKLYGDDALLAEVRRALASEAELEPLVARQLHLLEFQLEENQIEPAALERLVRSSGQVERSWATFAPRLRGQAVAVADLYEILQNEREPSLRQAAWEALAARGEALRSQLLDLVKLRNRIARQQGFADFYQMRLQLEEVQPAWLQSLVERLARQTEEPFERVGQRIRADLIRRFDLAPGQLRPWHFADPSFLRAPTTGQLDLDPLFVRRRPEELVEASLRLVGLDLGEVLAHSDLKEHAGKLPQALCLDLDRSGDVRILADLRPCEQWTATLLHEAGHALYHLGIDPALPWALRTPASPAVSEAVAVLFGRWTRDPAWLERVLGVLPRRLQPRLPDLQARCRADELLFLRFCLVMIDFERELYRDPDQDLDHLWWQLRSRYQGCEPPPGRQAADWAAQAHLVVAPVYYHNYLLGRLLASQLRHELERQGPASLLRPETGTWLRERVFAPGASLPWDALVRQATGEPLDPKYFLDWLGGQAAAPEPER